MKNGTNKNSGRVPGKFLTNSKIQLALFVFTLIYIISPVDLIPDVPPIGFVDDLAVFLADLIAFLWYLKQKRSEFRNGIDSSKANKK